MPINEWPARVFDRDRPAEGGSGLLIDRQWVLTCAHVVDGMSHPMVRFPARPDVGDIPAVAHIPSRWRSDDDVADIAVLRLPRPVTLRPARFAPLHALDFGLHDLVAIGFPRNTDERGRIAPVIATTPNFLLQGEWIQLESTTAFGPSVGRGYSGGAVVLRSTSEVVGIITAADRTERLGLMLPLVKLVEHYEDLADLLPLGPIGPRGHRELRSLLIGVRLTNANHAYQVAVQNELFPALPVSSPQPGAGHDAYAVACHIADGLFLDDPSGHTVRRCLARLCHHVATEIADYEVAEALRRWANRYGLPAAAPGPATSFNATFRLVVRIARSGAEAKAMLLDLMVHAPSGTADRVHQTRLAAAGIRSAVEDLLPGVISAHIPQNAGVVVEFVLPRSWLSRPVEEWTLGRQSTVQVGWRHQVVVRDLAQFEHSPDPREAQRRWAALLASVPGEEIVYWVRCGDQPTARQIAASLASDLHRVILALANPPERLTSNAALRAGFDNSIPLMLWRRLPCLDHGCDGDGFCDGQRFETSLSNEIEQFLATSPATELPELVRRLRTAAGTEGDAARPCGRALTILWNPPGPRPRVPRLGLTEVGELR